MRGSVLGMRAGPLHVAAALAALVASVPLVYLVVRVSDAGWSRVLDIVVSPRPAVLALRSVGLALAVALTCMVVGIAVAWLVTRTDLPLRRTARGGRAAVGDPVVRHGVHMAGRVPVARGPVASWFVMVMACTPYVVLPVAAVLMRLDPSGLDVARTLGLGPVAAFGALWCRRCCPRPRPAACSWRCTRSASSASCRCCASTPSPA
ncbi:MAG: hypothetical protein U0S36_13380 [Candidatus Nanopelagicales bacterium]